MQVVEPLPLRPKQIEQLAFYIGNPKCLDLSDPGTGKTPPCCVYSYWVWKKFAKKTLWSMPKSLRKKNVKEMVRFTEFTADDVVILNSDRANLTKDWTGPTMTSTRRVATWELDDGRLTHEALPGEKLFFFDEESRLCNLRTGKRVENTHDSVIRMVVQPKRGPDGKPIKKWVDVPDLFKDLIAANKDKKVFICTFKFMSTHWQRLFEEIPEIDLLLVDELHMGYGGPESAQTDSFYWVNKYVSRFVGMTGTLINGRLDSAFPAIHVIRPEYYGSYRGFIYEHAAVTDDYGRVIVWKNEAKLRAIIEKHSIRRTFEEVYGDEDVVFFMENIEVAEEVRGYYTEFHEAAMLELDDGRILDGSMQGVALTRARQILGHPETMFKDVPEWTPKDERIIVEASRGEKMLIFAALQPEQERILRLCRDHLGLRTALINGNVSGNQRDRIDEAAQRGELDVIIASGPTAAVGWNWEMFDVVIFASIGFLDVDILQAWRRASRGSRTKTLRVLFLRYLETVEQKIYKINEKKSELANRVDPTRPVLAFDTFE